MVIGRDSGRLGASWRVVSLVTFAAIVGLLAPAARAARPAAADPGLQRVFSVALPGVADGMPAYRASVSTAHGTHDLVFVTTRDGRIAALDARNGSLVWQRQHGPGTCRINNGDSPCYTTSSPVVDPNGRFVYSYGLDGAVHKYQVGDGTEVMGGGWPETATLKGFEEKGSSALALATTRSGAVYLYMANGGYPGDHGDYQGHLTTINLRTGAQRVFNAACSNQAVHFAEKPSTPDCSLLQTAIWARPGAVYDPDTDRVYVATGNGDFDPASHAWGDSVLVLHADGTGANGDPLDTFTPKNNADLNDRDADLGSTEPAVLPPLPGSRYRHLAVQAGKDALLRILNLDNLSGLGKIGQVGGEIGPIVPVPQGGPVLTTLAVWKDPTTHNAWVFVADELGIGGLRLEVVGGVPRLRAVWKNANGGASPIVANDMLLYAGPSNFWALDPRTGAVLGHDRTIGDIHWEIPRAVGNHVYVMDNSARLSAFVLPQGH
jgi:PQQ enzyme repeat